jgi:indolepyruvate ferredoxin oxidoreductase
VCHDREKQHTRRWIVVLVSEGDIAVDDRFGRESGRIYLTGIQALARLPIDSRRADVRANLNTAGFISGYEGSPLGGYDLELGRQSNLLGAHDIVFRPAVNEELAATSVQGTQLASASSRCRITGVTGWWYGKSPGLDRAADAIRHNNLMGTHPVGGAITLVGDDPAAKSSTVPGSSDALLADLGIPTLYPADVQDVLDLGLHAVALSRCSGLWTALKIATNVADGAGIADVSPLRITPIIPTIDYGGKPYRHEVTAHVLQPVLDNLEITRNTVRLELARQYCTVNRLNKVDDHTDDRVGVVAAGKTSADLRQALRVMGLDEHELARRGVRLMTLAMTYPLDRDAVVRFAQGLDQIIVVEEKRPLLETAIKEILYGRPRSPRVIGKLGSGPAQTLPLNGELDADKIARWLSAILVPLGDFPSVERWVQTSTNAGTRIELPLVSRTPYFCSGCPHNSSAKAPNGSQVGGGIGCHGLVLGMDPREFGNVTGLSQMGGEGAQWIGMAPFVHDEHFFQNLGDGTYHHSASLAIRASVAAGVNITYKLLRNSAVAMTGGQQPAGELSLPQMVSALRAEGVAEVLITSDNPRSLRRLGRRLNVEVWHRNRLIEAQTRLSRVPGVTVLIHNQECATELRRKRKRGLAPEPAKKIYINERICEGCGDCGRKSNCLSVQPVITDYGRKTQIDQSSCNKDYACLEGDCPAFISVLPSPTPTPAVVAPLTNEHFPEPECHFSGAEYTIRILGVGGTGVVTLSQLLATAAATAGFEVRGLDQTGLSQKGGAVVSDVKLTREQRPLGPLANKAAKGEADLLLGCDLLVSAAPDNLAQADPNRTVAVVSTSEVATGAMVSNPTVTFPDRDQLVQRIESATVRSGAIFVDARRVTTEVFGRDHLANVMLAGAAYQAGRIPVPASAIEAAIRTNGVQVEANIQAFRLGRRVIADPKSVPGLKDNAAADDEDGVHAVRSVSSIVRAASGSELERLVAQRVNDLVAYQNAKYAERFAKFVERVRAAETANVPGSTELTESVARYLHKLMAYKDEYEVARLSLVPELRQQINEQFGPGAKIAFRLHPPILRAVGMRSKISLGSWIRPVFAVLYAARRLRGTPLDLFGYSQVRRTERALIDEYRRSLETLLAHLSPHNHAHAVAIAQLPDVVRGYEEVKMANAAAYRDNLARQHDRYMTTATAVR